MKNPYDKQIGGTHYQKFKIQPSKFVIENELLYPEGCVIKYILRHRLKGKKEDLKKELGDVLWYVSQLASELGLEFEDIAQTNLDKLFSRMDRGVLGGSGDNR